MAVPACQDYAELSQPDGKIIKIQLQGDEFFSWNETQEGYAILKDAADGFWKFAKPAKGKADFEIVPGSKVGTTNPSLLGLRNCYELTFTI